MKTCPDCGDDLRVNAKRCKCGWVALDAAPARQAPHHEAHDMRCSWENSGDRCRYFGTCSSSVHGGGPYYCRGHYGCSDPAFGQIITDESKERMRGIADWSGRTALEMSRRAFLHRPLPERCGYPISARFPPRVDTMQHVVAAAHLRDPEAEAERAALQDER